METAELIRKWRTQSGLTQTELAIKAGISLSNVQNTENAKKSVSRQTLRKLSEALGRSLAEYDAIISPQSREDLDRNVVGAVRELPSVVEWPDLNVAASHFVNIEEVGEIIGDSRIADALRFGRFRIRIRGKCMEPTWLDGELVEFEFVRGTDFIVGQDYYIESNDGATFKRCTYENEHIIVIACRDDPKKEWRIKRRDVRRAARALHALVKRE